jgi:TatD DNase family protein
VDTHCHCDYLLERTRSATWRQFLAKHPMPRNYRGCITTFCDPAALSPSLSTFADLLASDGVFGCFGMHPHNAKYYTDAAEARIVELCRSTPRVVAFGEIGLDMGPRMASDAATQRSVFQRQLRKAGELGLPVVVHSRDAPRETLADLKANSAAGRDAKVDLHCFGDDAAHARAFLVDFACGCVGITAAVGYANSHMADVAKEVPLDRILLETDAPYMPASGSGGGRGMSTPAIIPKIAEVIARLKGITPDAVLEQTFANAKVFFSLPI